MPRILFFVCILTAAVTTQAQSIAAKAPAVPTTLAAAAEEEDCGCDIKLPADNLAIVNGIRITRQEVEEPLQTQLRTLRQQVITARQRELELQINSRLLDAEAKRRGISAQTLIDEVILAPVKAATEAEAQAFYEQNKQQIQAEFATVKDELRRYLLAQRQREAAGKYAAQLRATAQIQINVPHITSPETTADHARVLATVNDHPITAGDVEASLQPLIARVQEELYQLRNQELTLRINDTLLQQEAQQQKVTPTTLLKAAIKAQATPITEAAARQFYDQNKARISGEFAQVREQIIQYLQQNEERKVEEALAIQLRQKAQVEIFLAAPMPPAFTISTEDQPMKGAPAAPITIVEFTDFQCPSCAQAQPIIEQVLKDYAGKVKLVIRDFPLEKHADAFKAAEAAEAARAQGKYWEYVALLFQNQSALSVEKLQDYAAQLNLDTQKFNAALKQGTFAGQVQRDYQEGLRLGVNGTPTLFVNGRRVAEPSYEALKAALEKALPSSATSK